MKKIVGFWVIYLSACLVSLAQVDTTELYSTSKPYGALDIRIAKSATWYYYLQENITFSYRESSPGVKTNTYYDMTSWDSSPYSQGNLREKNGTKDNFVMNYRLLFPKNYTTSYTEGYPLIVMMHGAGERANCWDSNCWWDTRSYNPVTNKPNAAPTTTNWELLNNDHNLLHGGAPHLDARNRAGNMLPNDPALPQGAFPGFVLFAQNLNGWDVNYVQNAIKLIRLAVKKYKIDPNRIYIHGLSNGGAAVYEALKRAPWLFSAAAPMSAISESSIISKGMIPYVATTPIWTFQGGQDTSPNPFKTESYVKAFREGGMNVTYTLYPNLGHGTWNTAYSEPNFFPWLLSQNKSKIHVFYNNPVICGTTGDGAKLGYTFGFLAYEWQKDGVTIPGATSAEYIATQPGVYRARFSRVANPTEPQWNKWSQAVTVTLSTPPQAAIQIISGTTCMKGPDNNSAYSTIKLKSVNKNDHYYWYKNGVLINIPANTIDDTVRLYSVTSSTSTGNGAYTLLNKGNDKCPSAISDPLNLYFGNSAPYLTDDNIPTNFQGTVASASETDVTWTDNSSVETTYEIWRKKTGGIYQLAGKTAANATSFHDSGLEPSTTYNYKIRAVNTTGRSKYAPSDNVNTNLVITTLQDLISPSAPTGVAVTANTVSTVSLKWNASTDNTGISKYVIFYGTDSVATVTNVTSATVTGLTLNTTYAFTVKAVDLAGLHSPASSAAMGTTHVTGLIYGHSTGAWTDLDLITSWNTPEFTGVVPRFTIDYIISGKNIRTQEDYFYFQFDGYINITTAGVYQFRTTSDDGSRLALKNVVIVDNDGLHGNVTVTSANQTLSSGPYPINVKFFEYNGGQYLKVEYKGPDTGNAWKEVPDAVLNSGTSNIFPARSALSAVETEGETESDEALNVYPVPTTSDNLNFKVKSATGPVQVRLIDSMGRSLYENLFSKEEAEQGAHIAPKETLNNGIYIIVVNKEKKRIVIKN
jgi:hypothetical protein